MLIQFSESSAHFRLVITARRSLWLLQAFLLKLRLLVAHFGLPTWPHRILTFWKASCRFLLLSVWVLNLDTAHGTGTRIGDALEAEAFRTVYDSHDDEMRRNKPLWVSSSKTLFGHCQTAAMFTGWLIIPLSNSKNLMTNVISLTQDY